MAVAAVNCPVTATEVWKVVARATKSGPNIRPTVMARKIAAARHTSKTAEGQDEAVIRDSFRRRTCRTDVYGRQGQRGSPQRDHREGHHARVPCGVEAR